jgi:NitT/TauT family transport system substrate-binding protein
MKFPKFTKGIIIFLFTALIIGGGIYYVKKPQSTYQGEFATVRLALPRTEATAMPRIALHKNFFRKHGIKVKLSEQDLSKYSFEEVLNGNADLAAVEESPIIHQAFKGTDFVILSIIHTATRNVKLLAKKSNGVTTLTELREKKIGVVEKTSAEFFLFEILRHLDMSFNDVEIVYGSNEELETKFRSNEIDAVCLREPHIHLLNHEIDPDNSFISHGKDNYLTVVNLVGSKEYVNKNPEIVKRFLNALKEAENEISVNKERAIGVVADDLNLEQDYLYESCIGAECNLSLTQRLIMELESEASWLINNKGYSDQTMPDFKKYLALDLLEYVKPDSTRDFR